MLRKLAFVVSLIATLSGCSYSYDIAAIMQGGNIVFVVDPKSSQQPGCVRRIDVREEGARESIWMESVDYKDDCENRFPIIFGATLKGTHQNEWPTEGPERLQTEVVYVVGATTGATGYGSGRFIIHANGSVKNLPFPERQPSDEP